MPDRFDLTGQVAVVTGGSRGLGRAMAMALAEHGATVVVASRKLDACQAAAADITDRTGRPTLAVACHVGRWEDADRLVDTVYGELGRADILVNNAGMSPPYPTLAGITEDLWHKVIAVNLGGPFRLMCGFGLRMREAGAGSIVNISSIEAAAPLPHALPYAAAKAGVETLTSGLARALAPVRVNCVRPGPFLTDISAAWEPAAWERAKRERIPLGRGGEPEEIVGAVLYLAGPAASYTTGAVLTVDGGITC